MLHRLLIVAFGIAVAGSVKASPAYPGELAQELSLPCQPSCLLCHTREEGGFGTANTPLGAALRRARLECCDEEMLASALALLERDQIDSDGDGTGDVEELRAALDPNQADAELACRAQEAGGCSASKAPRRETPSLLALLLGTLSVVSARRSRSRE